MTNISKCPKCGGKIIQPDKGQPFPSGRLPHGATGRPTYDGCICSKFVKGLNNGEKGE